MLVGLEGDQEWTAATFQSSKRDARKRMAGTDFRNEIIFMNCKTTKEFFLAELKHREVSFFLSFRFEILEAFATAAGFVISQRKKELFWFQLAFDEKACCLQIAIAFGWKCIFW